MRSICHRIIDDFESLLGLQELSRNPWYVVTAKGGPNALLKIIIPPSRFIPGYVLTVARHAATSVIAHETDTLVRLRDTVPRDLCGSLPEILARGRVDGVQYFGLPFYRSHGQSRLARRLMRGRRWRWVAAWLTDLAGATVTDPLDAEVLEREYSPTILTIQRDSRIPIETKRVLEKHLETACRNAGRIQGVCCHGDIWNGNLLWLRGSRSAIVLDWGAVRWPGLPSVDLCHYALNNGWSANRIAQTLTRYCHRVGLDPSLVPALNDLYKVFVKAELDVAYATQPQKNPDLFLGELPSTRLSQILG